MIQLAKSAVPSRSVQYPKEVKKQLFPDTQFNLMHEIDNKNIE